MSTSTDFPQPHRVPLPLPPASPPESAVTLIHQAHQCVVEAARLTDPAERFATAYPGALRAAAAVPALRGRPRAADDLVRQAAQFGALVDGLMHEGGQ